MASRGAAGAGFGGRCDGSAMVGFPAGELRSFMRLPIFPARRDQGVVAFAVQVARIGGGG